VLLPLDFGGVNYEFRGEGKVCWQGVIILSFTDIHTHTLLGRGHFWRGEEKEGN
jgi:hypothetical protein